MIIYRLYNTILLARAVTLDVMTLLGDTVAHTFLIPSSGDRGDFFLGQ